MQIYSVPSSKLTQSQVRPRISPDRKSANTSTLNNVSHLCPLIASRKVDISGVSSGRISFFVMRGRIHPSAGFVRRYPMLYDSVPGVLSELIRTAFIPRLGYRFIVSDFSAIEARVLSHLAGEKWRADVFHNGRDIYCESASGMFGVPVEKHGQNAHLRQKGKIAELALGYGGSVGALKAMGALDMGLTEDELQPLVTMWRESNPNIAAYWWVVDEAVKTAIEMRIPQKVGCVCFEVHSGILFITLPSGRCLAYVKPRIGENKFGGKSVTYLGIDAQKKWSRIESYGPKFVENIVQAVSRDILAYAMRTLNHCFICGHVHDELIIQDCADRTMRHIRPG